MVTNVMEEHTTSIFNIEEFFTLKMKAESYSEIMVTIYQATLHHIPEDSNLHSHCCENLKCCLMKEYSETLILRSWILHFSRIYTLFHGPGQMPITIMLNVNGFYVSSVSRFP
jgi:hypothetical protein